MKNHVYHPPYIDKLLNYIKESEVVSIEDLQRVFPKFHGGSLSRLYKTVEQDTRFLLVKGKSRWCPTVVAYFGENSEPKTPKTMAVDFFRRIPPLTMERLSKPKGGFYTKPKGKEFSIATIMKTYKIDVELAKQVMNEIERFFGKRLLPRKHGKKTFLRRY